MSYNGYNFAPVMQALDGIQRQRNVNDQREMQYQRMEEDDYRFGVQQDARQQQLKSQQANQNAMMAFRDKKFEADQAHRNSMLGLQRQQVARASQPKPTTSMREYEFAMGQNKAAGRPVVPFSDWRRMNSKAGATQVNVGAGEKAYDKEIGKQRAKYYMEGQKSAQTARRDANNLKVMSQAIQDPNLYTGTGAKSIHALKKTASSLFGVPIKGVQAGEVVSNLSKTIAVGLKSNLPGPLSDSDRRFLVEMAPGLQNTPEGNRQIIQLGMLQKEYQVARAKAASDYAAGPGRGRIDAGFDQYLARVEDEYAQKFSGLIQNLKSSGVEPNRSPAAGVDVGGLRQRYGLE